MSVPPYGRAGSMGGAPARTGCRGATGCARRGFWQPGRRGSAHIMGARERALASARDARTDGRTDLPRSVGRSVGPPVGWQPAGPARQRAPGAGPPPPLWVLASALALAGMQFGRHPAPGCHPASRPPRRPPRHPAAGSVTSQRSPLLAGRFARRDTATCSRTRMMIPTGSRCR